MIRANVRRAERREADILVSGEAQLRQLRGAEGEALLRQSLDMFARMGGANLSPFRVRAAASLAASREKAQAWSEARSLADEYLKLCPLASVEHCCEALASVRTHAIAALGRTS